MVRGLLVKENQKKMLPVTSVGNGFDLRAW